MEKIEESKKRPQALEITAALNGRRIGLCGYDASEAQTITSILAVFHLTAIPFDDRLLPESGHFCEVALLKLSDNKPDLMRVAATSQTAPILVACDSRAILQGVGTVYSWARDFIVEPWSASELLVRLFRLLDATARADLKVSSEQRNGPLILIADDDTEMAALTEVTLRTDGIVSKVAKDGVTALRLARQYKPDLMMLDIRMPGISGFDVLEAVRRDPCLEALPVMMLTGCDEAENVERGAQLQADEYLTKPISPIRLLSRVKRVLATHERKAPHWAHPASLHSAETPAKTWIRN